MVITSEGGKAGTMERVLLAVLLSIVPSFPLTAQSSQVLLATTTSTRDAGLLDSLLPIFERQTGYRVKLIAVGSGQALELGPRGCRWPTRSAPTPSATAPPISPGATRCSSCPRWRATRCSTTSIT